MVHRLHAAAGGERAAEGQIVVAAGQVNQVFIGAVQQFHAQDIHIETFAFLQVGHEEGDMAQAIETTGTTGHFLDSIFVYNY
ncbi:hypothetical protein FQZ97_1000750 [compost metagenome]